MRIPSSSVIVGVAFIITLLIFIGGASASSPFDIEFPIPELANCATKTACKAYCDNPVNEDACHAFAAKHGFGGDRKEVEENLRELEEDGGPGGCALGQENPTEACRKFCDQRVNIRICVEYAKDHDLMEGRELEEAEKVINALEEGAELPRGCRDVVSCKATCENPKDLDTARSCFEFAEKAQLLPHDFDREKAERVFKAFSEGKTPFRSFREMQQCENPPNDEIFKKCIDFGIEIGLIKPEEAEIVKKTGGKGPGGCRGEAQCRAYCETHEDECMVFAEEHGLMRPEDRARMQEGMARFKEALDQAPDEVKQCLKEAVGAEVLDQILAGTKMPTRLLGERMRACFEQFFSRQGGQFGPPPEFPGQGEFHGAPGEFPAGPGGSPYGAPGASRLPPQVRDCLAAKFGDEFLRQIDQPTSPLPAGFQEKIGLCIRDAFGNQQAGPGGCKSREECVVYCTDPSHGEECKGFPPSGAPPQDVVLPEGYKPPGYTPEGFRPPEGYRSPEGFQYPEGYRPPEGFKPPEGFQPPEGYKPPEGYQYPPQGTYPEGYRPPEGYHPPEGYKPPEGYYIEPPTYTQPPPTYTEPPADYRPPDGTTTQPPPPPPTDTHSFLLEAARLLVNVLSLFLLR